MGDEFGKFINEIIENKNLVCNKSRKEILHGDSVQQTVIPKIDKPYISFHSSDGKSFFLNNKILSRHILLLGGIGVGKTNVFNLIMKQLFSKENGEDNITVIFDTKGDFINKFYTEGDIVIANDDKYKNLTYYWNVFEEIKMSGDYEAQELMAKEIGKNLFNDRKSSSQPFFANAAMDIFSKTLIHFLRVDRKNKSEGVNDDILNNHELCRFFQEANVKTYINMCKLYPDFKGSLSYFGTGESNQALGVFGELNSMINDYFVGVFSKKASIEREFSMRKYVREKKNRKIFIEYDLTVGDTLTPMYRLLIDIALKEALGRSRSEGDVYLIIDEFKLLPKLQHLNDALNFGRSLGIKVIAGIQNISQLFDIYGESGGAVVASGFSSIFAFRTPDSKSREYVSHLFGRNYYTLNYFNSAGEYVSENREGYTVEDWDLLNLGIGEAVIGLANFKPFYFSFEEYHERERDDVV